MTGINLVTKATISVLSYLVFRRGLDKSLRAVLAILLVGYCSGVILSRWIRETENRMKENEKERPYT